MSTSIVLPKNHYFLKHADDIDKILMPLKRFGITTFTFMRKLSLSRQIYISNNANWVEDYFENAFYGQFISKQPLPNQNGCIICPSNSPLPVFSLARDRYDSDHVATFVKSHTEHVDFYFFSGSVSDSQLVNFYVNNKNIIEKFILYFHDRAEKIINNAHKHTVSLDQHDHPEQSNNTLAYFRNELEINSAINEMHIRKYLLKQPPFKDTKLSARELDTIFCLFKGMSAKETALQLNISQRTVEDYLENIKTKLSCFSKADILKILVADGFPIF